jgi:hypothetical protein
MAGAKAVKKIIEELSKRADAGDEVSLMFLHNTNSDKLVRTQAMGGMPMPSIAVTDKSIPFEGFGDITLVGKPSNFDPKTNKLNQAFSADAYTVRAPQPVRVARKGAGKRFDKKFGAKMKDMGIYGDETVSNIWDLERKGEADPSKYENVKRFFTNQDDAAALFLDEKGIKLKGESRFDKARDADKKLKKYVDSGEFEAWGNEQIDEIFSPEEYFISNPDRDYYTTGAKLKPYNADDITKFMKKNAGRGGEGGMGSIGNVRASTTEEIKSLQGMRDIKDRLQSPEDIAEFKQTSEMMFDDLRDAFREHYKYDQNGFGYLDEFAEFVKLSETKGIKAAGDEVGFDVPDGLAQELTEYKDMLRGGATEYFESKPKRVVDLNEFGGAIVPEGTDQATMDMLNRAGIQTESYVDEAGRLAARKKFKDYMFQAGGVGLLGGMAAGYSPEGQAYNPYTDQSQLTVGSNAEAPLTQDYQEALSQLKGLEDSEGLSFREAVTGAVDLAGAAAYGMGTDALKGLGMMGGLIAGKGGRQSIADAEALAESLPEYNIGPDALELFSKGYESYKNMPESKNKLLDPKSWLREYMRMGDYWGDKAATIHPAAGAAVKAAFEVI